MPAIASSIRHLQAARKLRPLLLLAATLPLPIVSQAQTNVTSTLAANGGTFNFGDSANWTSGVPDASNPAVISGAFSANLIVNILNASASASNYTVGDISFTDTITAFRDFQIGSVAGGTLALGNTVNTWTFGNTGGGLFQLLSNAKLSSTASQSLVLTSDAPVVTTATTISSGGFRFNNTFNAWGTGSGATDSFLGTLVLAKGSFYTTANTSVFGTNGLSKAITLGTDTNVASFQLAADQTIGALNGNAQSFIFHNNTSGRRVLIITGSDNGTFAGTVGSNGNSGFTNQGLSIRKSGNGTQIFSGPIVGSNVEITVSGGILELSGANTFTTGGGTTIVNVNGGTLRAASASALSSGTVSINGGTLSSTVASITSGGVTFANGALALNGASAGGLTLANNANFVMSGGSWNFTIGDQISGSGTGTFNITGGILDLGNSISNYSIAYSLLAGFASGNVSGLTITGYDTAGWTAALDNTGSLSFTAVPEPSAFAALAGLGALGFVASRRRRR